MAKQYVDGLNTAFIADQIMEEEIQYFNDVEDGFVDCISEQEDIANEVEVHPMFLKDVGLDADDFIPASWFEDTFNNTFITVILSKDEMERKIANFLDEMAMLTDIHVSVKVGDTIFE